MRALFLASLAVLAALAPAAGAGGRAEPASTARRDSPRSDARVPPPQLEFGSLAVIGASVSAGFRLPGQGRGDLNLADCARAVLGLPPERCRSHASTFLFLAPEAAARAQIDALAQQHPTHVLALDFLFWFAYGGPRSDSERMDQFERGLALLAPLNATLVLGDVPDMGAALSGSGLGGKPMLRPGQMPSAELRQAMNARLASWAQQRTHVLVLPLARMVQQLGAGQEFAFARERVTPRDWTRMQQTDRLHATDEGTAWLAIASIEAVLSEHLESDADWLLTDPQLVVEVARATKAAQAVEPATAALVRR